MTRTILPIAILLASMLGGCGASLKDIAGPCGFDLTCNPDEPDTWPLPPLKLIVGGSHGVR